MITGTAVLNIIYDYQWYTVEIHYWNSEIALGLLM